MMWYTALLVLLQSCELSVKVENKPCHHLATAGLHSHVFWAQGALSISIPDTERGSSGLRMPTILHHTTVIAALNAKALAKTFADDYAAPDL